MKLVGHKAESVYPRYAMVAERDSAEGVAKLAMLREGTKAGGRSPDWRKWGK
jgi:hypothetical protein